MLKQAHDEEIKRVLERCLTNKARRVNLEERIYIQAQRGELVRLRLCLEANDWSPELEDELGELRLKLGRVLLELSKVHMTNNLQQEAIALSCAFRDKVSIAVDYDELQLQSNERAQANTESEQSKQEQEIVENEETNRQEGRRKFIESLL